MAKYPDVTVELSGQDGNGMMVLALVLRGLRRAGVPAAELDAFAVEATSGNYDHLLQTAMAWVEVE